MMTETLSIRATPRVHQACCLALLVGAATITAGCQSAMRSDAMPDARLLTEQPIGPETLLAWPTYGIGKVQGFGGRAVIMTEAEDSKGVVMVSPQRYGPKVILRYDSLTLRPASVLVAILSASSASGEGGPALPEDYDGAIGPWVGPNPNYFFAFHNAPHNRRPFVNRVADGQAQLLAEADRYHMQTGQWHEIEVGRWDDRLWLEIDGARVLDVVDDQPLGAGHLALRIRGTGPEIASAMIRNVRVLTPQ